MRGYEEDKPVLIYDERRPNVKDQGVRIPDKDMRPIKENPYPR